MAINLFNDIAMSHLSVLLKSHQKQVLIEKFYKKKTRLSKEEESESPMSPKN